MVRRLFLFTFCIAAFMGGIGAAVALTASEKTACATASVPAKTLGVDGAPVYTIPGATDTQCVTVTADTVTQPGPTTTVTQTVTTTVGTTTAPPPTTTAPPPTTTAPPPTTTAPPPGAMDLSYPGTLIGSYPEHGCADPSPSPNCAVMGDLKVSDYQCWSNVSDSTQTCTVGVNERFAIVDDPAGSGRKVTKIDIFGNDDSDHYGGTRAEIGVWNNHDHKVGGEAWFAWSWYFPTNFQRPDGWGLIIMQNHGEAGNPPQAVYVAPTTGALRFWTQQFPSTGRVYHDAEATVTLGRWHHFLMYVKFSNTGTGIVKGWHSLSDSFTSGCPDPSSAPLYIDSNVNTLYSSGSGFAKVGEYRAPGALSQHQVGYLGGYGRSSTGARANANAGC